MTNPKISIIIPVYKAEKSIRRCIDSILTQTYTDWELLLIDDGSPDRCGIICEEYAEKDCRIKVFHKINGGVSSARNVGIKNACGQFVTFCDSDDYVQNNWLASYRVDMDKDISIQGFTATNWEEEGDQVNIKLKNSCDTDCSKSDLIYHLWDKQNLGYLWCRLFRLSIIIENKIRFDENIKLREDQLFISQFLKYITTFQTVDTSSYMYECDFRKYRNLSIEDNYYSDKENYYALKAINFVGSGDYFRSEIQRYGLSLSIAVLYGKFPIRERLMMVKECRCILKQLKYKELLAKNAKVMYCILFCFL